MTSSLDASSFTVPLTAANRAAAQQMAAQMPDTEQAQQVERNLLAMLATQHYLTLLGFRSNAETSWDVLQQWLGPVAELQVPNGILNCWAIAPDQTTLSLPEVVPPCLGTVVVQLSQDHHETKILGLAPATTTQLHRQQLRPLDALIDALTETPLTRLQDGFSQQVGQLWTTLETLMSPEREPHIVMAPLELDRPDSHPQQLQQMIQSLYEQTGMSPSTAEPTTNLSQLIQQVQNDELRWRAAELLWELDPDHPSSPIIRAKDLGLYLAGHSVALLVGLLPKTDGQVLVLVRVCSIGASPVLPRGIQFQGHDIEDNLIFDLASRQRDDYIQFKFTAEVGDRFTLTVRLDDGQIVESFVV